MPQHEKSRSEQLIEEARQAVQDESVTKERFQQLAGDLYAVAQIKVSKPMSEQERKRLHP